MSRSLTKQMEISIRRQYEAIAEQLLDEVVNAQVVSLNRRLDKGVGLDDKPMPMVGARYAKKRGKMGRLRTMLHTGHTRRSIRVTKGRNVRTIGVGDTFARDKIFWNHVRYPFWGISPEDRKFLQRTIERVLRRAQKRR